jgi:hypothetical protein
MDNAVISAVSGVLGSLVGGSATVATTLAHWQNFSAAGVRPQTRLTV